MKKTFKGTLALAFCIVTVFATMLIASALSAPKAKVKSVTYNTVTISWSAVKGADAYQVQRSTNGKDWKTLASSTKSTSYKDTKLTAGKTYRYRVRSIDRGLLRNTYSSWSSVVKGKPVPAKVTGLKAASKTYKSVKLSWSKVSGASGYLVQRYTKGEWKTYKTTTKTGMTISKLTLGKTYQYRVRAYRTVSKKKVYGPVSATLKTGPELKAPSSFVLKGVTTSTLNLSWSAVEGAKGYEVYNKATKKWTNTKTKRTLTVKNLKSGTKYEFIVRAYSGSYDGVKSATRAYTTTPAAPKSVKVTSSKTNSITFSWGKVTGATRYQPAIYNYSTKKWTNLSTTTGTSATAKSLTSGTKYAVRVRAYVKNSNVKDISETSYGSWSSQVTAYTTPAAPKSVKLSAATTSTLTISWSASTGATGYELYSSATEKWISAGTKTSYKVTGLASGTKYSFKVRAVLNGIKSAETSSYSFITSPAAPAGLTNTVLSVNGITIANSTVNSVTVNWNKVTGAAKYQVQYSADGSTWTSIPETASTTAKISGLNAGTAYSVRVRAYNLNSNVKYYGAYATITARTLSSDTTTISAAASDSKTIQLDWNATSKATAYVVEKFFFNEKDWKVLVTKTLTDSSKQYSWKSYAELTELSAESSIATNELSYLDSGNTARSDIYRVHIVDADGYVAAPSAIATGKTSDMSLEIGANGAVTIEWPKIQNATVYEVQTLYPTYTPLDKYNASALSFDSTKNSYTLTVYLAPESINSLIIYGCDANNNRMGSTGIMTFVTGELPTGTSDAAKNSQLLYLARAINNTKLYTDPISVKCDSTINLNIESFVMKVAGLPVMNLDSPEEINEFFASGEEETDFTANTVVTESDSFDFVGGKAYDANGKTIARLSNTIQPAANAHLVNGHKSTTGWKNGFSSVTATKNSDGSYLIKATLKQEKNTNPYHDGYLSTFNSGELGGLTEGLVVNSSSVGASTISATIDSDGILKKMVSYSPYSMSLSMETTEGDSGKLINMELNISGSNEFDYSITR